ncbi:MAG TPA: type II toxin-antitoxin system Phd/YefM family antitoxin [Candidatus Angelobacter sp.]|nr:type II toxin-antitoxin system Phd/YefM family antitoxin [Candidatus Angelobacter sp.]
MSADSVISAFDARTHFSKYLRLIENGGRSVVIRKRGIPRAVLVSIRDYLRLASPEPEILRLLGEEAKRNGTNRLTSKQIDCIIRTSRARRAKRR